MRPDRQRMQFSFGFSLTPAVKVLLAINVLVFLSLVLVRNKMFGTIPYDRLILGILAVNPDQIWSNYTFWQLGTYAFVHLAFFHLLFNMLALVWFGSDVESHMGTSRFLRYYFFTAIGAGLVSAVMGVSTIGASGAIYGLLLAYGLMFPNRVLYIYFVIPIKAKYCVFFFGLLEFLALMGSGSGQINHAAHLSGLGFGAIWFFFPRKKISIFELWKNYRKNRMRKKLRIVAPESKRFSDMDNSNPTIH